MIVTVGTPVHIVGSEAVSIARGPVGPAAQDPGRAGRGAPGVCTEDVSGLSPHLAGSPQLNSRLPVT